MHHLDKHDETFIRHTFIYLIHKSDSISLKT